jgi:beta-aspartyl-peptidase (threonine type)
MEIDPRKEVDMSRHVHHKMFLFVLACGAVAAVSWAGSAPPSPDDEARPIRQLLDRQVEDWNRRDLEAFLEGYWHAPGVVFQAGAERFDGFEAMRARYRARYQAEGKEMGRLAFSGLEVVILGADSAFARARWQLTMSDGKQPGGLFTLILRKFPEGWRIVHDHTSS